MVVIGYSAMVSTVLTGFIPNEAVTVTIPNGFITTTKLKISSNEIQLVPRHTGDFVSKVSRCCTMAVRGVVPMKRCFVS